MRKGFNFYRSYWDVANELNDKDRLAFYDALLKKQFRNEETELNGMVKFAYLSQKHSIDKQIDGYISQMSKRHPNEDPWQGGTQGAYIDPTQQEKEKEKEQEKEKEKEKLNNKFTPPNFNDVLQYCMQNNYEVDCSRFINLYESKGWMVGKNKMNDWKAAIRTWVKPKQQVEISPEELKAIKLGFLKPNK